MIGYRYEDGRAAVGFRGDAGDCVVRAIAILTRAPYADIYRRMAAAMKQAGYAASGDGYRQKPRPGLRPHMTARQVQNPVKASCGLRRIGLAPGPRPTCTEAWARQGDCLVGTARHVAAIVDGNLRDTFDGRLHDGRAYGGTETDERKAQSIWAPSAVDGTTAAIPIFDSTRPIRPPTAIHPGLARSRRNPRALPHSAESPSSPERNAAGDE